jgi:hypothetical protein
MRRRLNVRLLVRLVASLVLLGLGVALWHRAQLRRNVGVLLDRADQAELRGDLGGAEESLRLFLGYRPQHPGALARYGSILARCAR